MGQCGTARVESGEDMRERACVYVYDFAYRLAPSEAERSLLIMLLVLVLTLLGLPTLLKPAHLIWGCSPIRIVLLLLVAPLVGAFNLLTTKIGRWAALAAVALVAVSPLPTSPSTVQLAGLCEKKSAELNWVVRAGVATPESLQRGSAEHPLVPGLYGFSVQHQPGKTVIELAAAGSFPNAQISVTTVEQLVAAAAAQGYVIGVVRSPGRGFHHDVRVPNPLPDDLAQALAATFVQMPNPARRGSQ